MGKKTSGGKNFHSFRFLRLLLSENKNIRKYEIPIMLRALKRTIRYFYCNTEEFSVDNFFKFKRFTKKASNAWAEWRKEHTCIPQHDDMKYVVSQNLKDYLNSRGKYTDMKHREVLPDGTRRDDGKNIY